MSLSSWNLSIPFVDSHLICAGLSDTIGRTFYALCYKNRTETKFWNHNSTTDDLNPNTRLYRLLTDEVHAVIVD